MIRKTAAVFLAFLMFFSFSAFSEGNDPVFNELGNYLLYMDRLLEDDAFAIKYVEKFNETRTYDDLLIARTAIQSALREIRSMEVPTSSMTDDEYFSYMIAGAEVEALALLYEKLEETKMGMIYRLESMYETMLIDVYFEPALENLAQKTELYLLDDQYEARDLAYMTNYLLLQLKDGGETDAFWEIIKQNTSVLKKEMDAFYTDLDQIALLAGENLDRMGENVDKLDVLGGFADYFLQITIEAAETGDLSVFKNNRTEIAGETQVFLMPEWRMPMEMEYTYIFCEPETGDLFVHSMGNEINYAPDRMKITSKGVTIDDMQIYLDSLDYLGYNPVYEFGMEDGVVTLYVLSEKGGSQMDIIWTEDETIVYLTPPAASLVPYMYWK